MNRIEKFREIELKLLLDPKIAQKIDLTKRSVGGTRLIAKRQKPSSVYFDTVDDRLRKRKVALRVRHVSGKYVQTLKTAGSGGALSVRGEWECEVLGPEPELDKITDPKALEAMGLVLPEELQPAFATRFERQKAVVEFAGSQIEIALDRGYIEAPGRKKQPICEIELELKEGDPKAIIALVEEVRKWAPFRVGTESKAVRGYRLRNGDPPSWSRAQFMDLKKDTGLEDGIRAIFRDCMLQWMANEAAAIDGGHSEGVHQLRVSIRRLRSAIVLFRPWLDPDAASSFADRLRDALKMLGPARELDVFIGELVEPCMTRLAPDVDLAALHSVALKSRDEAYDTLRAALQTREYADLVLDLVAWTELDKWQVSDVLGDLLGKTPGLLNRLQKRLIKRGRHFEKLPDEERHALRIDLKKLRYAVDFLSPLYPGRKVKAYRKRLAVLQDQLGRANDLLECKLRLDALLARDDLGDLAGEVARTAGFLHGWHASALRTSRAEMDEAWFAFIHDKPFWQ